MPQGTIDGFAHDKFAGAREVFEANFKNGEELGASFCATVDGETAVARRWPEFAANGKDRITVDQLMSHSSGLSGWRPAVSGADFYDWEKLA
ncbi:beta-lactamase [Collimonas sp. PA-H2]|uniref:serine hydrolase n=1 Tax=Collimonas sp. PA-H2 TaxID=1881062 RepID=UPI000C00EF4A|nr:serine hydrolase [Collimonas sp. PA-H2]PFH07999.1 beta-lactamase [Collimonas sp. PA-H2]